jgi:hypothetical protein
MTLDEVGNDSVSIDRIDSSNGYTPSNTVLCRAVINSMKSNLSEAIFPEAVSTGK